MHTERHRGYLGESFVVYHCPVEGPGSTAILLLPPLGYEDTSAYRPLRVLADGLARAGFGVLRLDWPGLGDSGGSSVEADLHERRIAAVRTAITQLRASGFANVGGVAVRAGALLALAAGGFDELVLWACPRDGRRFLREERAFHAMAAAAFGKVEGPPLPEGSIEAGGFFHNKAVVEGLGAIDPALAPTEGLRRVLLISRDGSPADAGLGTTFAKRGIAVDHLVGSGLSAMLENAYQAGLSASVMQGVLSWLGPPTQQQQRRVSLAPALHLPALIERPWSLSAGAGTLSGIVCAPAQQSIENAQWNVFFNAGGIRRCGPNGLWTRAARTLAASGRPSLRFDVRDVGDSDGTDQPHADLEAMYAHSSVEDALAAVDWVADQNARHIDVTGLCSGAFLGAQVSARRTIRRAVLFNGLAFVWNDDARASSMTSQVRGSLFNARRWRRLLTGKIDARALLRSFKDKARLRAHQFWSPSSTPDPVATLLAEVQARGTDLCLVSSEGDPSIAYLESHVLPGHRPSIHIVPGADHTLRPVQLHEAVVNLIVAKV